MTTKHDTMDYAIHQCGIYHDGCKAALHSLFDLTVQHAEGKVLWSEVKQHIHSPAWAPFCTHATNHCLDFALEEALGEHFFHLRSSVIHEVEALYASEHPEEDE